MLLDVLGDLLMIFLIDDMEILWSPYINLSDSDTTQGSLWS